MPLPSSGAISLNQIHVEAGASSGTQAALNDADIRDMIGKSSGAQNAFNEYYGVSASTPSVSYRGRASTTGNGFPLGYINSHLYGSAISSTSSNKKNVLFHIDFSNSILLYNLYSTSNNW